MARAGSDVGGAGRTAHSSRYTAHSGKVLVLCVVNLSLYSTATQNHLHWVLLRHLAQKIILLRYLTQEIPTCWYLLR